VQYTNKVKITTVIGIGLIVFVASLVGLPFMDSESDVQKITNEPINKLEESEEKMLDVIMQEKSELESKIGGKFQLP